MGYTVGQVSAFAGVTVRTLHRYDRTGLLSPGDRSRVGYRRYDDADLARLQQILFHRELGFALDEIARLQRLAEVAERAVEVQQTGVSLTPEERFEVFGEIAFDLSYATEAQLKWRESEGHRQAMARPGRLPARGGPRERVAPYRCPVRAERRGRRERRERTERTERKERTAHITRHAPHHAHHT